MRPKRVVGSSARVRRARGRPPLPDVLAVFFGRRRVAPSRIAAPAGPAAGSWFIIIYMTPAATAAANMMGWKRCAIPDFIARSRYYPALAAFVLVFTAIRGLEAGGLLPGYRRYSVRAGYF